jgi:DNA-binding MarR family transcriptional regulator
MADIIFSSAAKRQAAPDAASDGEPIWDVIELLFFAYRDFVSDPDHVLEKFGFGRAHHRVLHFVNRNPGMKVADLLDILRITKQSLGRVLKQLVDEGYVIQKEGPDDRRHRLLFVTPKGEQLAMKLAGLQTERITRALAGLGPNAHEAARNFLALRSHYRTTRRTCLSSTTTGAFAICCPASCSPRVIASPRPTTRRMRAPSWVAFPSTCSSST